MLKEYYSVTTRIFNDEDSTQKKADLWKEVISDNNPLHLTGGEEEHVIAEYHNYEVNNPLTYDYTIIAVTKDYMDFLELLVEAGRYHFHSMCDASLKELWNEVDHTERNRKYSEDFEFVEYDSSKQPISCSVYISVESSDK